MKKCENEGTSKLSMSSGTGLASYTIIPKFYFNKNEGYLKTTARKETTKSVEKEITSMLIVANVTATTTTIFLE